MPHVLYFLLLVLSRANYACCSFLFTKKGENVTLQCQCSKNQPFWVRMNSNASLQIVYPKCEQSPCRFTSKGLNSTHVALTIFQAEPGDSGKYFCGARISNSLHFSDNKIVLTVGDVWTSQSKVHLLTEWMGERRIPELDWNKTSNSTQKLKSEWKDKADANSKSDWSDFPDVEHTELRCVVTGLSGPWVNIIWRSSQESWAMAGQTWSLIDAKGGYRVESRLWIGLKEKYDLENEDEHENSLNLHKKMNLDRIVEMDEELWCEVQVGVNFSVRSPKISLIQQTNTGTVWCNKVLYGEIALCAFCMCLLIVLTCLCLQHQHKVSGPPVTEVSPTFISSRDVTYAPVKIKKKTKTDRRQGQKHRQEESPVYSELRCNYE